MGGLAFLSPVYLAGALAALIPVAIHLLKRNQTRQVPFSAVRFLQQMPMTQARHHRLRELLVLCLRVAALLLLALAFARPYLVGNAVGLSQSVFLVLLDSSFSMSAPGQFDRARTRAEEVLSTAGANELVGVMTFNDQATLLYPPSMDRAGARQAVKSSTVSFGGTRYDRALSEAVAVIGDRGGRILVITDLQRGGWASSEAVSVPSPMRVELFDTGGTPSNLAVSSVTVHQDVVRALVGNTGSEERPTTVSLSFDGARVGRQSIALSPRSSQEVMFNAPARPQRGAAIVSLEDSLGPLADNSRFGVLDPVPTTRVLLMTPAGRLSDALYVERALTVGESEFTVDAMTGSAVAGAPLAKYSVIGVLATHGLDRRGAERLATHIKDGGGVFIAAGPQTDFALLGSVTGLSSRSPAALEGGRELSIIPVDARHPTLQPLASRMADFSRVRVRKIAALSDEGHVLARFDNGAPALLERQLGRGRVVVFASDLNNQWNDFPVRALFLPFLHQLMRYLASDHQIPREYVVANAPMVAVGVPGVYVIGAPPSQRRIAVNVDVAESDGERLTASEFLGRIKKSTQRSTSGPAPGAPEHERQQRFWQLAVVLMVSSLLIESLMAGRPV